MPAKSPPSGLSPLIPMPWAAVRQWLDEAENLHRDSGGSTAHLSHVQLLALSQFVTFIEQPVLPKEDHVSKLLQFTQSKRLGVPNFATEAPVEVPVQGAFQLRWLCRCLLPWCNESFPQTREGQAAPLFANKKDAKQWAAMEALAFLMNPNAGVMDIDLPPTPQPTPPLHKQVQIEQQLACYAQEAPGAQEPPPTSAKAASSPEASNGQGPKRPLEASRTRDQPRRKSRSPVKGPSSSSPSSDPTPRRSSPKAETAADQGRLFGAIARLAGRLGIAQPQYRLEQDPDRPNFFRGCAEFSVASRVPDGIAVVENVLGKRQARIQIAEKVMEWMVREEAMRQAMVSEILG